MTTKQKNQLSTVQKILTDVSNGKESNTDAVMVCIVNAIKGIKQGSEVVFNVSIERAQEFFK